MASGATTTFRGNMSSSPDPLSASILELASSPATTRRRQSRRSFAAITSPGGTQRFDLDVTTAVSPQRLKLAAEGGAAALQRDLMLGGGTSSSPMPGSTVRRRRRRRTTTTTLVPVKGLSSDTSDELTDLTPLRPRGQVRRLNGTPVPAAQLRRLNGTPISAGQSLRARLAKASARKSLLSNTSTDDSWRLDLGTNVEVNRGGREPSRLQEARQSTPLLVQAQETTTREEVVPARENRVEARRAELQLAERAESRQDDFDFDDDDINFAGDDFPEGNAIDDDDDLDFAADPPQRDVVVEQQESDKAINAASGPGTVEPTESQPLPAEELREQPTTYDFDIFSTNRDRSIAESPPQAKPPSPLAAETLNANNLEREPADARSQSSQSAVETQANQDILLARFSPELGEPIGAGWSSPRVVRAAIPDDQFYNDAGSDKSSLVDDDERTIDGELEEVQQPEEVIEGNAGMNDVQHDEAEEREIAAAEIAQSDTHPDEPIESIESDESDEPVQTAELGEQDKPAGLVQSVEHIERADSPRIGRASEQIQQPSQLVTKARADVINSEPAETIQQDLGIQPRQQAQTSRNNRPDSVSENEQLGDPMDLNLDDFDLDKPQTQVGAPGDDTIVESNAFKFSMISVDSLPSMQYRNSQFANSRSLDDFDNTPKANPNNQPEEDFTFSSIPSAMLAAAAPKSMPLNPSIENLRPTQTNFSDSFSSIPPEILEAATPGKNLKLKDFLKPSTGFADSVSSNPPPVPKTTTASLQKPPVSASVEASSILASKPAASSAPAMFQPARFSPSQNPQAAQNALVPSVASQRAFPPSTFAPSTSAQTAFTPSVVAQQTRDPSTSAQSMAAAPPPLQTSAASGDLSRNLKSNSASLTSNQAVRDEKQNEAPADERYMVPPTVASNRAASAILASIEAPLPTLRKKPEVEIGHQVEAPLPPQRQERPPVPLVPEEEAPLAPEEDAFEPRSDAAPHTSSVLRPQMRSSPPAAILQNFTYGAHLRTRSLNFNSTTPAIVFSSPKLPPLQPPVAPRASFSQFRDPSPRPPLSPVARTGRILQDVVAPLSSPSNRSQSLGSPFKSPASSRRSIAFSDQDLNSPAQTRFSRATSLPSQKGDRARSESLSAQQRMSSQGVRGSKEIVSEGEKDEDPFLAVSQSEHSSKPQSSVMQKLPTDQTTLPDKLTQNRAAVVSNSAMHPESTASWQEERRTPVKISLNDSIARNPTRTLEEPSYTPATTTRSRVPAALEQRWAREREAVSKQISDAPEGNVLVVSSEAESDRSFSPELSVVEEPSAAAESLNAAEEEEYDEYEEDVWLAEAHNSTINRVLSSPELAAARSVSVDEIDRDATEDAELETEGHNHVEGSHYDEVSPRQRVPVVEARVAPRRSKLPSPWRKNSRRLVYSDEIQEGSSPSRMHMQRTGDPRDTVQVKTSARSDRKHSKSSENHGKLEASKAAEIHRQSETKPDHLRDAEKRVERRKQQEDKRNPAYYKEKDSRAEQKTTKESSRLIDFDNFKSLKRSRQSDHPRDTKHPRDTSARPTQSGEITYPKLPDYNEPSNVTPYKPMEIVSMSDYSLINSTPAVAFPHRNTGRQNSSGNDANGTEKKGFDFSTLLASSPDKGKVSLPTLYHGGKATNQPTYPSINSRRAGEDARKKSPLATLTSQTRLAPPDTSASSSIRGESPAKDDASKKSQLPSPESLTDDEIEEAEEIQEIEEEYLEEPSELGEEVSEEDGDQTDHHEVRGSSSGSNLLTKPSARRSSTPAESVSDNSDVSSVTNDSKFVAPLSRVEENQARLRASQMKFKESQTKAMALSSDLKESPLNFSVSQSRETLPPFRNPFSMSGMSQTLENPFKSSMGSQTQENPFKASERRARGIPKLFQLAHTDNQLDGNQPHRSGRHHHSPSVASESDKNSQSAHDTQDNVEEDLKLSSPDTQAQRHELRTDLSSTEWTYDHWVLLRTIYKSTPRPSTSPSNKYTTPAKLARFLDHPLYRQPLGVRVPGFDDVRTHASTYHLALCERFHKRVPGWSEKEILWKLYAIITVDGWREEKKRRQRRGESTKDIDERIAKLRGWNDDSKDEDKSKAIGGGITNDKEKKGWGWGLFW